jgi:hypothetical protein
MSQGTDPALMGSEPHVQPVIEGLAFATLSKYVEPAWIRRQPCLPMVAAAPAEGQSSRHPPSSH